MSKLSNRWLILSGVLVMLGLAYAMNNPASEPFFNNDETRHVMTGVYFRDLLHDMPLGHLRDYTVHYYLQYPALGILVWPPFFYFVEGVLMSILGTSFVVAKALVCVYAAVACAYLFFLVCRTHDTIRATTAALIFGLSPLVFRYSHHVMLEVPTLATGLAAIFYFVRYLDQEKRRDLIFAGLAAALTALTRFDAVYLLPCFLILLIARRRLGIIRRWEVLAAAFVSALLVLPFYALTTAGIGWFHLQNATVQYTSGQPAYFSLHRLLFYPACVPDQLGMFALVPAMVGLLYGLTKTRRGQSWPYLAMIVACYATFTLMAEIEPRHTIYWIPAFALFAADGISLVAQWLRVPKIHLPLAAFLLLGIAWSTIAEKQFFVRGYEEAARYVVANSGSSNFSLFQGGLNGDFIYQMRRQDPARRLWVLRADKIFYSVLVNAQVEYKQYAESDEDILGEIFKYDPEFIVIEEGPTTGTVKIENRVRALLINHPEQFRLERVIAVESNNSLYQEMQLKVFRNLLRNNNPERHLDIELLMLRRSIQTDAP
ncbi:MAG TPA: glycosyltransferase family 39 protein [Pyrinomonadaceae bacterium]|nr:glycosyltransferase family 39 protein [Pyrinomonadaceae bacterium]